MVLLTIMAVLCLFFYDQGGGKGRKGKGKGKILGCNYRSAAAYAVVSRPLLLLAPEMAGFFGPRIKFGEQTFSVMKTR